MVDNDGPVRLTPSMIPNFNNFDVKDSSFFRQWRELPSPKEVKAQAEYQHRAGVGPDPRTDYSIPIPYVRPPPVVFEDMGLLIKWGRYVGISEALVLLALGRFLEGHVPVPEVYGWRTDGDEIFIYMEYVGTSHYVGSRFRELHGLFRDTGHVTMAI
ncbi:hypothetical protein P170DRAFT_438054 [Aspergillus steynii IBT 23096]|uniref:Aminoglycoside phosphotransferase domain-containing protein n=1 Tax=Aspergillus steynii IBT 23096 TaxID=1392250 RepID=A0A2I2G697_9EURO|nr:uncharacterized protein P170DRAFT_438054 [Aspergillus steynii IBT 23096]PLB48406.1 hypothetical protein P170DRAFT_438054 [Aspergillus steynii IBT 23096]